jgi:hypothetical protein
MQAMEGHAIDLAAALALWAFINPDFLDSASELLRSMFLDKFEKAKPKAKASSAARKLCKRVARPLMPQLARRRFQPTAGLPQQHGPAPAWPQPAKGVLLSQPAKVSAASARPRACMASAGEAPPPAASAASASNGARMASEDGSPCEADASSRNAHRKKGILKLLAGMQLRCDELESWAARANAELGQGAVVLVWQKHGEAVFVPPGWVQCVLNLQACIKVAHDRFIVTRFPLYAKSAHEVASCFMHYQSADDYMAPPLVACSQVFLQKSA